MVTFLAVAINQQQNTYKLVFKDGFESFPRNWTIETGYGTVTKSSNVKPDGSYSLRIYSPDVTDYADAYTSVPGSNNTDFHIQIWFYVDYAVVPDHFYIAECRDSKAIVQNRIVVNDEAGVCYIEILHKGDGYNPANYMNICEVSKNTWHKLDLYWLNSLSIYNVHVDDLGYGSFQPRDSNINVERLYLGDSTVGGGGFMGLVYYDNLTIERSPID
ncbi:MAG: hypothetical protein ABSA11_03995 [Candidatus Bathyarchaeia archaeon]|jgi:hypothetical protein